MINPPREWTERELRWHFVCEIVILAPSVLGFLHFDLSRLHTLFFAMHTQLAAQNDILAYPALVNDIAYGVKRLARTGRSSIEQGQRGWDATEGKRIDGVYLCSK
jgi:hypothetical protein